MTTEELIIARKVLYLASLRMGIRQSWTRGWFARDASSRETNSLEADACRWCAWGHITKARAEIASGYFDRVADALKAELATQSRRDETLDAINDGPKGRTRAKALMDDTIRSIDTELARRGVRS